MHFFLLHACFRCCDYKSKGHYELNRSDIIVVGIFIRSKFEFRLKLYLSAFAITKTPKS